MPRCLQPLRQGAPHRDPLARLDLRKLGAIQQSRKRWFPVCRSHQNWPFPLRCVAWIRLHELHLSLLPLTIAALMSGLLPKPAPSGECVICQAAICTRHIACGWLCFCNFLAIIGPVRSMCSTPLSPSLLRRERTRRSLPSSQIRSAYIMDRVYARSPAP